MSAVSIGGTAKGTYLYNANGQLLSRTMLNTTPSGTIHLIHDLNGNLIAEADSSGTAVREYVWVEHGKGNEGRQTGAATPVALFADLDTSSPKLYYVASDHLSRPVMMTDATKAIVWQATFLYDEPKTLPYQILQFWPISADVRQTAKRAIYWALPFGRMTAEGQRVLRPLPNRFFNHHHQ